MIATFAAEWLKVRTIRSVFWMLFVVVVLTLLIVSVGTLVPEEAEVAASDTQLDLIVGPSWFAIALALLVGIVVSTGEFRHQTITPTLLATPRRRDVVLAKGAAGAVFGAAAVGIVMALSAAVVPALISSRGLEITLDGGETGTKLLSFVGVAALWGALGSAVGLLVRNQIAAVVGSFLWLFLVEHLLVAVLQSSLVDSTASRYLPLQATAAALGGEGDDPHFLSGGAGFAVLIGWALALSVLAGWLLSRRDVN